MTIRHPESPASPVPTPLPGAVEAVSARAGGVEATVQRGMERLRTGDPELYGLISREHRRQNETLLMVAASSLADPAVLACAGTSLLNTTTEGYPGARYHAGCEVVDGIERLAIDRACRAFGARYANVQPHSGTSANQMVMFSLLRPGDTVLGLHLDAGGHLSHGARASVSGVYFGAVGYGLDTDGRIDMGEVRLLAQTHRPRLIVCGASAYPRVIDFAAFRAIADEVGAYLLADISHIAGLVAAGEHPSPIDHAHFTTTSTYKQLCGPRGGLVLMGRDHDAPAPDGRGTLSDLVQRAAFPFFQGTPDLASVAAKASALAHVATPAFREIARRVTADARALAVALTERGYTVLSGGTDNHIVLVDVSRRGLTGVIAERALESCGIIVNKNRIPGEQRSSLVTSGVRFGTNGLAIRGLGPAEMPRCADLVHRVLSAVRPLGDRDYALDPVVADSVRAEVAELCSRFPIPGYTASDEESPVTTHRVDTDDVAPSIAAFVLLLSRYTGDDEVEARIRTADGVTPLRFDLAVDQSARAFTARVRAALAGRRVLAVEEMDGPAPLGISLQADENGALVFDAHRATADRIGAHFRVIRDALDAQPERGVVDLPLFTDTEEAERLRWNATEADLPHGVCLHAAFEARVDADPAAVAIRHGDGEISYGQLEARANRLAHRLRGRGVGPESRVGICVQRGPRVVEAILGVLKAGGAYVPLDPTYPPERLAHMMATAGVRVLVTEQSLAATLPDAERILLDADAAAIASESDARLDGRATPENLAYVIFTSGSTGQPKGIALAHRGVMNNLADLNAAHGIGPADRVLLLSSLSFDMSVYETLGILAAGGAVVIPQPHELRDPGAWAALCRRHGVTLWNSAPALLGLLAEHVDAHPDEAPKGLRLAFLGGDWVPVPLVDRVRAWAPDLRDFIVMGGATEASIHSIIYPVGDVHPAWRSIPYGVPMANQRAWVLDQHLREVPVGVAGELFLGGIGLARGYVGRAGFTAERFLPCPHGGASGARMYRTGDLARQGDDGMIELLGRIDHQVKIRGFRIEPGEIEAVLRTHPAVHRAVVVAREDVPGEKRLVAYIVGDADADALRAHLSGRLPDYMVPSAYVRLDTLPLSPNGKVDRKALPAPPAEASVSAAHEPPSDEREDAVASIWAEVLGCERVGRRDDFFHLGGHSLLAVRAISRVRQAMGVDVAVGDLFARPVLADFARALADAGRSASATIERVERTGIIAPSFAQQRLWILEQLGEVGAAYHIPVHLRLRGELDRGALVRALDRIVARHEALRTAFPTIDGEPVQRIASPEESPFRLVEHDLRALPDAEDARRRLISTEARAPFDLANGPLVRGRLIRIGDDDHVLIVTMHHIVSDGWSIGVLYRELGALYAAFARGDADPLAPLPVQYADYAAWHRRWADGPVMEAQAAYWQDVLSGAPELLDLPADRPRPPRQDFAGETLKLELDEGLTVALKALSQRHGATLFMTLLAGWAAVLARLSGQDEIVIGTPTANRGRAEVEELIGFFVNTLALRVDLSDAPTTADLLARVKARALEAQRNQDLPFEQVVERVSPARSLAYTPLFQVMFAWQNASGGPPELPGLVVTGAGELETGTAQFDLTLSLWEDGDRIAGDLNYATALFYRPTVERFARYLRRVLEAMAADEGRCVTQLPLMSDGERAQVVEAWNRTAVAHPERGCVHHLVEAQAARNPAATAVTFADRTLTYGELNARANRLAHHLIALGVAPDERVALCIDRGPEMVVAMLAVVKAGGAYVPLDSSYPDERLRYMLADSRPVVLLASPSERFAAAAVPTLDPADEAAWAHHPDGDPRPAGLSGESLCYVIYTSGSTGRPKGVAVPHGGVQNLVHWHQRAYSVTAEDRATQFASPAFDAAAWETWPYLAAGAELHLLSDAARTTPASVLDYFSRARITLAFLPTPVAEAVLDEIDRRGCCPPLSLRALLTGGDALHRTAGAAPFRLVNHYGPTESSVVSTAADVASDAIGTPPIGLPIDNQTAYVLDRWMNSVPVGVAGELFIGGVGLARGYLRRPAMTAERFLPDPFSRVPGGRLYRTGDRVRRRASGELEFLGRTDFQVKIRGFRIELGEIEAGLRSHPAVRDTIVVAREEARGERRLIAYVTGDVDAEALRAHLIERFPAYMVPAAFVRLPALPLTPNGKIDRAALPAPDGGAFVTHAYEAPSGHTEEAIAAIWAELLGTERVGRGDDFFALGGHSLLAMRVVARVHQILGVEAAPGDLFERPVLADFARALATAARAEAAAIEPVDRTGIIPLSFAQQRLWFLEQLGGTGAAYHIPLRLRLRGELDRGALVRALDRIVARHEVLRTTFPCVDGAPVQRISSPGESACRLIEHDLRATPDPETALRRLMQDEAGAPFDLAHGPLIRGRLIRIGDDDHVLLVTMHHIVGDGWSTSVLYHELGALYAAFTCGDDDPLAPLPVQYADYAAWHRRRVDGPAMEAQAEYWTRALGGAPELLDLPTDHARPARQDFAGASVEMALDEALTAAMKTFGQRHGATPFMTLLAAWAAVLSRLSGQSDIVIGTPTANRGRGEIEGLIGFFVNTLPVRVDLSDVTTVAGLLARVKTRALEAQRNQDIPFEQVVERVNPARSLSYAPLFQVMFAWQDAPGGALALPGLSVDVGLAKADTAAFDLSLTLWEEGGRIGGDLNYATALFEQATAQRFVGYLRRALEVMVADESQSIDRLPLLPEAERHLVVEEWNATSRPYSVDACIHDLFRAQAARTPQAVALSWRGEQVTYSELEARANRIANALRRRGVGPEVRVGICLPRTPDLVAALLGVLAAGGAYVPLDPAYPRERLGYMLEDAEISLVLTDSAFADRLPPDSAALLLLDRDAASIAAEPADAPQSGVIPGNLSHVIFTSGSTGRPKGVMIRHVSVVALLYWLREIVTDDERESVLFSTSVSFDVSVAEIFGTLAWGGKLVIAENALDLPTIGDDVVYASMVPSAAAELLRSGGIPAGLKTLNMAGEALSVALAQGLYALGTIEKVGNLYGPTEDTSYSTYHLVPRGAEQVLIGMPAANSQAYVLDVHLEPVPVGVAGELYLAGDGLAVGYARRPAMTAERFLPCPFGPPGARMYRSMDRVRHRVNGELEYLGRTDFQVKVRGYRIELGEIEARLAEHPAVRAPIVLAREDVPGDRRLVAYYLANEAAPIESLKAHLSDRLPAYMVPEAYVWMQSYPQTPNGKVDRKALSAPEGDAYAVRAYEAPSGETEQALAKIWAEVLRIERVGRHDNFFDLGGHSLLAVQVISRVRQALGAEVELGDLFTRPVLADFARGLATSAQAGAAITRVDRSAAIPLSFAQQRLWFLEQLGSTGAAYHLPLRLRLRGALDRGALALALDRIVARHEVLRTSFASVDGEPVQWIAPAEGHGIFLQENDLSECADAEGELRRLALAEAAVPFDLARGPLIRGRLVRLAEDDHALLITVHHAVSDGWSLRLLEREIGTLYAAFARGQADPLPPLPVQYADYAAWQRGQMAGAALEAQWQYWAETLSGAPELLELPTDRPRPPRQDHAGATLDVEFDEALVAGLAALGRRHGTTPFMTVLAAWAIVLSRLSGQTDVVIGTGVANRGRLEIEGLIGFFVNTLALRVDVSGAPTVAELLRAVRERVLEAQRHQDVPFEQVVERLRPARSLAHTPIFQAMLAWQDIPGTALEMPGIPASSLDRIDTEAAQFDLWLGLALRDGRLVGSVVYATALFDRATVQRHVGYLRRVLRAMAADDSQPVDWLPLLTAEEEAERRIWNATEADLPHGVCLHEAFEARVDADPAAIAILHGDEEIRYGQLEARANRLAHHLRGRGVGPESRVGICVQRGPRVVEAILGVLKAGGAYVPLDPTYPADRLAQMMATASVRVLVTEQALAETLPNVAEVILLDADSAEISAESDARPRGGATPENLAYVIFTSGSTGQPKGIALAHRGVMNNLADLNTAHGVGPADRVLLLSSLSFDMSVYETLGILAAGGSIVIPRPHELRDPAAWAALCRLHRVTVWNSAPALLGLLAEHVDARPDEAPSELRLAFLGGDWVPVPLVDRVRAWAPRLRDFIVMGGATEASIHSIIYPVGQVDPAWRSIPYGVPMANQHAHVLDARLRPVPTGVAGELFLGGIGLARGYMGQPGLTAERFVPDPVGGVPGARLYRTGDLVRLTPAGPLELLGRIDFQVKIRGFRIELGEIEAALRSHPAVHRAVVVAREDVPGEKRLVAYVVGDADADALRAHLSGRLPDYMVPSAYVRLDTLPLSPNGKVDRRALPVPEADPFDAHAYEAPAGEREVAVAEIWAELMGLDRVSRRDHFFDLGGHSLLAVRVISRVRQALNVSVSAGDLFARPVLADFAGGLETAAESQPAGIIGPYTVDMLSDDEVDSLLADLLSKQAD